MTRPTLTRSIALSIAALTALACAPCLATPVLASELASFTVFAGAGITNATTNYAPTGSSILTNTTVMGKLGTTNTTDSGITGFFGAAQHTGPGTVNGSGANTRSGNADIYQGSADADPLGFAVQVQLVSTMAALRAMKSGATYGNLAGMTLAPGVYSLTGVENLGTYETVVLDAQGDANAMWVFLGSSSIVMQTYSTVKLVNGARAGQVYWDAVSSVTLGTGATMAGNFLADTSITMGANVTLCGRALANTGNVTFISDTISCNGKSIASLSIDASDASTSVPEPTSLALMLAGLALIGVGAQRRRKARRARALPAR